VFCEALRCHTARYVARNMLRATVTRVLKAASAMRREKKIVSSIRMRERWQCEERHIREARTERGDTLRRERRARRGARATACCLLITREEICAARVTQREDTEYVG